MNYRLAVQTHFQLVKDRTTPEEIVFVCPEKGCNDESGNRSVNVKTGKTNCWRCGKGGDFVRWAKNLGIAISDDGIGSSLKLDEVRALVDGLGKERLIPAYVNEAKLPRGFTPVSDKPNGAYSKLIGEMAKTKQLEWDDMARAGVGFTAQDTAWEPYAIFPVVEWGRVVFYQGRLYSPVEGLKNKKFPSRAEVPLSSRNWIYNIDRLRTEGRVAVIVESILNVLSLEKEMALRGGFEGVVPVAVFKHAISKEQAIKLANVRGLKEICILYDSDATASAFQVLRKHPILGKFELTYVEMPVGIDANDDAEVAVDRFLDRKPLSSFAGSLEEITFKLQNL